MSCSGRFKAAGFPFAGTALSLVFAALEYGQRAACEGGGALASEAGTGECRARHCGCVLSVSGGGERLCEWCLCGFGGGVDFCQGVEGVELAGYVGVFGFWLFWV